MGANRATACRETERAASCQSSTVKINFNLLIAERSSEDSYVIYIKVLCKIQFLWQFECSPHCQLKGRKEGLFIMEMWDFALNLR